MSPSSRIPALLQPVVRTPKDDSLLLLTSTLDCSANWLLARFLYDALRKHSSADGGGEDGGRGPTKVVLVSWTRDYDFWRQEVRKSTGLDLTALRAQGRFAFVDGLSALFLPPAVGAVDGAQGSRPQGMPGASSGRGPPPPPPRPSTGTAGLYTLSSATLDHAATTITAAIGCLATSPAAPASPADTLVVLDNPDLLLAAAPELAPSTLAELFLTLHAHNAVSHLLVHLQSDLALLAPSLPSQPLQQAHQHLLVKTAHMSAKVLAVRPLDTGVARDVSGVLRATANTISWTSIGPLPNSKSGRPADADSPEQLALEVLYKLHGDGSVRVFERGTTAV